MDDDYSLPQKVKKRVNKRVEWISMVKKVYNQTITVFARSCKTRFTNDAHQPCKLHVTVYGKNDGMYRF